MKCENCNAEMRLIKAGISKKTGKPYNAFYSCPDCGATHNPQSPPAKPASQQPGYKPKEKVDWDGKEKRIVRQSMVKAAVEYSKTNPDIKFKDIKTIAEDLVTYVYQGLKE